MKNKTVLGLLLKLLMACVLSITLNLVQVSSVTEQLAADEYTLALWHFNEGEGQIVYDESLHDNDGTLGPTLNVEAKDPSWTTGVTGQPGDYALSMDDWYDYINIPDNPDESLDLLRGDQFTIEFWTYVRQVSRAGRGTGRHWNHFLSKYPFGTPNSAYYIYQCSGHPKFSHGFYDSTSGWHGAGCLPPPTHQWVHVMITYDSQYLRIYFDEELQIESDVGHYYVSGNDHPLAIGDNQNNDYPWTDGVDCIIDEVRLSSIARVPPVETTVDIDPDTLNLKSNGQWVTAYVTLPEGYSVEDIVAETVKIDDIPLAWSEIQDGVFMGKFDRAAVQGLTNEPDYEEETKFYQLTLTVTGELIDGTPFEGTDTIRVIIK